MTGPCDELIERLERCEGERDEARAALDNAQRADMASTDYALRVGAENDSLRAQVAALWEALDKLKWAAAPEQHGGTSAYPYEEITTVLSDTAAAARAHDERIHAAAIAEGRDYLAILCGVRHWKHVNADEAKTLAQAAQVIVNEYAEHFAVALDVPLVPPPTAAEPQREGAE